nr:MAG TPA: hypothetical protein [Caudoviricetes sp.]
MLDSKGRGANLSTPISRPIIRQGRGIFRQECGLPICGQPNP